jgi:alpha-D-xyloside xylohydrolase
MQVFQQQGAVLVWESHHQQVRIEPWGGDSLRVRATLGPVIRDDLVGALLSPTPSEVEIAIGEEEATIRNGALTAHISADGWLRFTRTESGAELLAEEPSVRATRIPARSFKPLPGDLFHLEVRFRAYDGERFYGLGQHQHGRLDQKGCVIDLCQRNTEVSIPFLVSSRGYGLLWHNPAVGRVELGYTGTRWVAEATPQLDYWITVGNTPADLLRHYADATGHPSPFPAWAAGFWQSKLRYRSQAELLAVAREYKRRGLPLSVIVIDFFHWTRHGEWRFDPELWPDPAAMVRELRAMGVEVMVSIWPTVSPYSEHFETMRQRGWLVRTERGLAPLMVFQDKQPAGPVYLHYYDATNPAARAFLWQQVYEHYYRYGIRSWWLDACEPEMHPLEPENLRFYAGYGAAVANIYPFLHQRGFYEHMQAAGETAILNLCRSAWAGSQRYGAAVWSGDIDSSFAALQAQVRAGLNMALSGIPWWTTDIGGFYNGDIASPAFRELIIRWFQYGVFCPLFRLHGYRNPAHDVAAMLHSGAANEVWSFGEEAYAIIKDLLFLREQLRPYIMQQMRIAQEQGLPPMRPLFCDFSHDRTCVEVDDEFLFGPDLLVAPVLMAGARSREVYLPDGTDWIDAWSGQSIKGGQSLRAEAPLERIPCYLRSGTSLSLRRS